MHSGLAEMGHLLHRVTLLSEEHLDTLFEELITERSHLIKVKGQPLAKIITLLFKHHRVPCPEMLFFNRIIDDVRNLKQILVYSRLQLENSLILGDELYSASVAYLASADEYSAYQQVIIGLTQEWRLHIN